MTIWQPDHVLTKKDADWLMEQGACEEALDYIGWTVARAARARPGFAIEYACDRLTDEQFVEAARARPWIARHYAPKRFAALMEVCK